ncbi:MAG: sodium/solute symporter [Planctomycetaceae bacterium]|nr:sodium/solute symporter [Planctomycetaceae bacterium]
MELGILDVIVFAVFVICVIAVGLIKSRHESTSEDYFLAGRGLSWWLIGFSLIAANISTEQFVGMSGNAASHVGLAIASYEWMAAITLVVVAFCFLPYFLRAGIYTIPEFLEYRYNSAARAIMAVATMFIYMLLLGAVTYSGALTIKTLANQMGYNVTLLAGSLVIGIIAMLYVAAGGLKACAWADLIQGSALIVGGAVIMVFAFVKLGGVTEAAKVVDVHTGEVVVQSFTPGTGAVERFMSLNKIRMNMFLPATDSVLPWTALLLGLWIPNFYYWGLNQYITQRTLGSKSLAQGQRGIVFAAALKLIIPFTIVIPGMIAFNLYSKNMQYEAARDNAPVFARYLKANPNTGLVKIIQSPDANAITNWPQGIFMLAVVDNEKALKEMKAKNAFVLPMTKAELESAVPAEFTVFKSDDKSWKSALVNFAGELETYNTSVETAAKAAGKLVATEKFIAFKYDTALAQLLGNVLPQKVGIIGFVFAALLGAVVSSLAAMLNAASTIFSMDIFKKYMSPNASQKSIVFIGRLSVVIFSFIAIALAPQLGNPKISNSIFTIIQEGQGFISPGILAVFVFGFIVRKAPASAGVCGLLTNIIAYGVLKVPGPFVNVINRVLEIFHISYKISVPNIQFLNRMAICFALCLVVMTILRIVKPLAQPITFKTNTSIELHSSRGALIAGIVVVVITLVFYLIFSPLVLAK